MLLRRITQHVKEQNWFAVGIDFIIVVFGVFIGIQVSNWNDTRQDRDEEVRLLTRLYDETQTLETVRQTEQRQYETSVKQLAEIWVVLLDGEEDVTLTPAQCLSITTSHIITKPTIEMPSLDELTATGKISLIQDEDVKTALRHIALEQELQQVRFSELANDPFRLAHLYPDLFPVIPTPEPDKAAPYGDGVISRLVDNGCKASGMAQSNAFKSSFLDNSMRLEAVATGYREFDVVLAELKRALETRLVIKEDK